VRAAGVLAAVAALVAYAAPALALSPSVTEYTGGVTPGFSADNGIQGIGAGPDGKIWFAGEGSPGRVGIVTLDGTVTELTGGVTPGFTTDAGPEQVVGGPDGNVWVAEANPPGRIARITPAGEVTEFSGGVTPGFSTGQPDHITVGPDGNIWFTECIQARVVRVTPAGQFTEFDGGTTPGFTSDSCPTGITAGPDGNIWFTEATPPGRVARLLPSGIVLEYTAGVTPGFTAGAGPGAIAAGPDGNLWFVEYQDTGHIGRITPSGAVTEFSSGLSPNSVPNAITAGPDGAMWFVESFNPGRVGRITLDGTISEFTGGVTPGFTPDGDPTGIVTGPDRALWVGEYRTPGHILRITAPPFATTGGASVAGSGAATVSGSLNANSQPASYRFEYGTSTAYGSGSAAVPGGSGNVQVAASAKLSGLSAGTTYHYRLAATNPTGTNPGADAVFTTPPLPQLSRVKISPNTFRLGPKGVRISRKAKRPRVGTTISFGLNRAAPVRLRFFALRPGRKTGKKCKRATRRNSHAKKCTRALPAGTISLTGHTGTNHVRFQGRISARKRLSPGRYKLTIVATDPTDPRPSSRSLRFRIVKG
jgi:streptogramin lyase